MSSFERVEKKSIENGNKDAGETLNKDDTKPEEAVEINIKRNNIDPISKLHNTNMF